MSYLNYEFFDEFKRLDNLCRDIYGKSIDNKLGVTMYLEDMDKKSHQGIYKVSNWTSDYKRLKNARNIRNELAHSRNSISVDVCSQEDIDFLCSFRARILDQTDPIALLRKQNTEAGSYANFRPGSQATKAHSTPRKGPVGCLGVAAMIIVVIVACIVAFLL